MLLLTCPQQLSLDRPRDRYGANDDRVRETIDMVKDFMKTNTSVMPEVSLVRGGCLKNANGPPLICA